MLKFTAKFNTISFPSFEKVCSVLKNRQAKVISLFYKFINILNGIALIKTIPLFGWMMLES